jgi:acyl-CoA thioesterase-1
MNCISSLFWRTRAITTLCAALFLPPLAPPVAAAAETPKTERQTIVVLGDSLAAGYGIEPTAAYPSLLQKKIDQVHLNFTVVNAGVSGDTSAGGLSRIDWLLKRKVDVLLIELGGNDGLRGLPVESLKSNLEAIINRTRDKNPQAQIVLAGMRMPANLGEYAERFQKVFPEVAEANRAALIPFLLEGVGGNPELNQPDQIHPTAEGHKIVAENVWKLLQPLLEKMVAAK